jgi:hypothetical protein
MQKGQGVVTYYIYENDRLKKYGMFLWLRRRGIDKQNID